MKMQCELKMNQAIRMDNNGITCFDHIRFNAIYLLRKGQTFEIDLRSRLCCGVFKHSDAKGEKK